MIKNQVKSIIKECVHQHIAETHGILTESQLELFENTAQRIQKAGIESVKVEIFKKGRESYVFTEFANKFEFLHQNGEDLVEKGEIDRQTFQQKKRDVRSQGFKLLKDGDKKSYFRSITGFIKKNYLKIGIGSVILIALIIVGIQFGAPYMGVMSFLRTIPYIGKMADAVSDVDLSMDNELDVAIDDAQMLQLDAAEAAKAEAALNRELAKIDAQFASANADHTDPVQITKVQLLLKRMNDTIETVGGQAVLDNDEIERIKSVWLGRTYSGNTQEEVTAQANKALQSLTMAKIHNKLFGTPMPQEWQSTFKIHPKEYGDNYTVSADLSRAVTQPF
jgi:hypothetical protein